MKIFALSVVMLLILPTTAGAAIPAIYTNDNFLLSEHDQPATLIQDGRGGFYGVTLTGKIYSQKPITNSYNLKLHKFVIDEAWFYMSDRGMIQADTDLVALSIYFARTS